MITPAFRSAVEADLPALVALLADDMLGAAREGPADDPGYRAAFAAIAADPHETLLVAEVGGRVVGCVQIGLVPGLSRRGAWRGQIEGVRVAADLRGRGVGAAMILHAVARCRAAGCGSVQLTTDRRRGDARRFYERLGFVASHEGMKLSL